MSYLCIQSDVNTLLYVPCGVERDRVRVRIFTCMTTWDTINTYTLFQMGYNTTSGSSEGSDLANRYNVYGARRAYGSHLPMVQHNDVMCVQQNGRMTRAKRTIP